MKRTALILVLVGLGCGQRDESPGRRASAEAGPPARAAERALRPGADIDPAVLLEAAQVPAAGRGARAALERALGPGDRPLQRVKLPRVPRAATAPFTFGASSRGWITRLPTGGVLPSVAYGDGMVYASGGFDTIAFYGLDARTGKVVWNRQNLEDNGPTAPVYERGEVIFNTESCTLFVLDGRTGKTRWKKWLGDPTLAQAALAQGLIYASWPAGGKQRIGALSLRNGRTVWSRGINGELLTTPVTDGKSLYATTIRGTVYRFDGRSGRRRWASSIRASSAPWIGRDRLYVSRVIGRGKARREAQVTLDVASGELLEQLRIAPARYAADVPRDLSSWPKVWAFEGSRPMLLGGRLVDTMGGEVVAMDPADGRPLWRRKRDGAGRTRTFAPPILAGSQVIVAGYGGEVYALDVDTGMTVWAYDLGRKLAAAPVVARGWLYLTSTGGAVVAMQVGGAELDGWHMWGGGPGHNG